MLTGVQCISTWLSHRLETVTLCLQGTFVNQVTDRRLFFSLLYFRFPTYISVSAFSTCPFRYRSFAPIRSPRITAPPSISNRQLCIFHTVGSVCTPPFQNLRAIETQNHSYSMVLPTVTGWTASLIIPTLNSSSIVLVFMAQFVWYVGPMCI